jgi:hypothetical protein
VQILNTVSSQDVTFVLLCSYIDHSVERETLKRSNRNIYWEKGCVHHENKLKISSSIPFPEGYG